MIKIDGNKGVIEGDFIGIQSDFCMIVYHLKEVLLGKIGDLEETKDTIRYLTELGLKEREELEQESENEDGRN